jgi:hypothetical protein
VIFIVKKYLFLGNSKLFIYFCRIADFSHLKGALESAGGSGADSTPTGEEAADYRFAKWLCREVVLF